MFHHRLGMRNEVADLARVMADASQVLRAQGVAAASVDKVNLGLEEAITNIIKYGYDDDGEHAIEVLLSLAASELTIVVADDGHAFNPLAQPEPAKDLQLEQREPGGLGIFFLRKLFDDVDYRRENDKNVLTLVSRLQD